jgi:ornithine--oxo-acid transaminase
MYDIMQPNLDISEMFADRQFQRNALHTRYLNEQLVRVLKTIGYDVGFQRGQGQYLYDRDNDRYLDLLSGFGVFALGRNHPTVKDALKSVLDSDLPNLVQLDLSTLAGILAERLIALVPYLDKVFLRIQGRNVSKLRSSSHGARLAGPALSIAIMPITGCPMAHCH